MFEPQSCRIQATNQPYNKASRRRRLPRSSSMTIRYPLTVLTLAALLMASGAALAGGMPSDEGPEVVPDELGFNGGDSLDEDTITAIIKSMAPEYLPDATVPAAYVTAVMDGEALEPTPPVTPKLPPALNSPDDEWQRDHR